MYCDIFQFVYKIFDAAFAEATAAHGFRIRAEIAAERTAPGAEDLDHRFAGKRIAIIINVEEFFINLRYKRQLGPDLLSKDDPDFSRSGHRSAR